VSATTNFREALAQARDDGQKVRVVLRSGVEVRGTVT
jgi:small nuclear ribonucleoprotein (snRNP)-like protein